MSSLRIGWGGVQAEVPADLFHLPNLKNLFGVSAWNKLDDGDRQALAALLPAGYEPEELLASLTSGENFNFGNPLDIFELNLKDGKYVIPDDSEHENENDSSRRIEGTHAAWQEHVERVLPVVAMQRAGQVEGRDLEDPDPIIALEDQRRVSRRRRIEHRAERRHKDILRERDHVPDKLYNFQHRRWVVYQDNISVWEAAIHQDTVFTGRLTKRVREKDFRAMLLRHKSKSLVHSARPHTHPLPAYLQTYVDGRLGKLDPDKVMESLPERKYLGCFFFLLYQIFKTTPGQRVQLRFIRRVVQAWLRSGRAEKLAFNKYLPWENQRDWSDLVKSALVFLGQPRNGQPPMVVRLHLPSSAKSDEGKNNDEKTWWRWDGPVTDWHQLEVWQEAWPDNQDTMPMITAAGGYTDYRVRPITGEERRQFHEQERERFAHPDRPYIYRMHGYESPVGPVKGCTPEVMHRYHNVMPRKHQSLIAERPPWVTAQALVRDAVARLPNGVGVRNDVLELLKYSQYFAPSVTDDQLHTVASGGLDRMSTEPDPCVRYDSDKKQWVYLHRDRYIRQEGSRSGGRGKDGSGSGTVDVSLVPALTVPMQQPLQQYAGSKGDVEEAKRDRARGGLDPPPYYGGAYKRLQSEMGSFFARDDSFDAPSDDEDLAIEGGDDTDKELEKQDRRKRAKREAAADGGDAVRNS